ncbi:MAG: efflux RND transporter permease subunit [Verrucomicrobia bacterium]|nr:efflux RND transporter permease subunit [Verrucomicrobiota bacterium]
MKVARFAVHRPVFTVMVVLTVIILGGVSLSRLPVDLMPDITYPTLSVSTSYENASPEEIEELITRPIEQAMAAVPGVEEISSVSSEGHSNVRVTFLWGTDLDVAASDIRDRLDRVIGRLPDDADRPALRKFDPADFPVVILGASSNLDPVQMRRIIDDEVKYRIERTPGVAVLDVWGGLEREIHVDLDPDRLKALEIPLDQVVGRIKAANITLPAGMIESGNYEITLRTPGEYTDLDQLRNTTIATRKGTAVRLGEVADVVDSWERVTQIVRINGEPGIRLSVNKQSGTNTVDVARRLLQEVDKINAEIPQIRLMPIIDTSKYIKRSITNVGSAATFGGLFAVLVLLAFLRNLRSTVIIAVAIPVSIVATFAMIYFGGFTLNLMTLGGLALGVGMLVDSSIVVLENIYRLREGHVGAEPAAVHGAEEVTGAIIASTLTTLAIFLPLILVRGLAGVMFKQLALVISFALLCSLGAALTLIPMLASRFLRPASLDRFAHEGLAHKLFRISGTLFTRIEERYKRLLHYALDHRALVLLVAALLLGASVALIPFVGVELMPQSDEGEVRVEAEMEVGTRAAVVDRLFQKIQAVVEKEVPERESFVINVGGGSWRGQGSRTGFMRIALKPQSERTRSSEQIATALRPKLAGIPGATIRTRVGQGLFLLRQISGGTERVEVEIRGFDLETADALARRVRQIVEQVRGVTDAQISRDIGAPERLITVDRAKAEDMKVSVEDVAQVLQTVIAGTLAGNYREGGDEFSIRVKLKHAEQRSLRELLDLTVANADGQPVVLRNIVSVGPRSGPVSIERKDQERLVTVRANIEGRDMGSIIADIREGLASLPAPQGFSIGFGGDYKEQQKTFRELGLGLVLAIVLVYIVMACLFESLRDPFVVMFSVPLAIIGVVLMLLLTNTTFNMNSYIGCIMLTGIVVNNAILLVDHTNLLRRKEGMGLREAIEEAGRRRLRPILMTAFTTSFGLLPLALGLGEGGEAQAPLARAVIGGLLSSTLITLVIVPVVYSIFERGLRGGHVLGEETTNPGTAAVSGPGGEEAVS